MTSTLEEEVNAYYNAKENYSELLYKCITELAPHKDVDDSHNPPPKADGSENWFTHRDPDRGANVRPEIDIATIIEMSKAKDQEKDKDKDKDEAEPSKAKGKGKSKGKK